MSGDDRPRSRLDEQAALQELERLERQIQESQRRRRQANEAFDKFLRSFRSTAQDSPRVSAPSSEAASSVRVHPRTSELPARELETAFGLPTPNPQPPPPNSHGPESEGGRADEPVVPAALISAPDQPVSRRPLVIAAVAVAAVGLLSWRAMAPDGPPAPAEPTESAAPSTPVPAPPPQAVKPTPAPPAELTTVRRVWLRVLVDGERVVERELDANVRIPLDAKERIVIRAGDAGAVRLSIRGKDQGAFGPDGIPVTRTFTMPSAPPRQGSLKK